MIFNRTITKKILEKLVHETFSQLGVVQCSSLLDSLKLLDVVKKIIIVFTPDITI